MAEPATTRGRRVLYLGRASRFATAAQRLALFARDRGCTAPGCTVPFIRTQAHHMPDWTDGGVTDIDRLGGACGRHNRMNGTTPGHWESTVLTVGPDAGHVGWRPVGRSTRWQSNIMFHPERLAPDPGHSHPTTATGPDDPRPDDPGPADDTGPLGDLAPPGDSGPPEDLGPPEEQDQDRDDHRSTPTIIVHYRPSPIRVIAPVDPPSGAEKVLARLLTRAV